jgi:thiosulfate dehydrogenase
MPDCRSFVEDERAGVGGRGQERSATVPALRACGAPPLQGVLLALALVAGCRGSTKHTWDPADVARGEALFTHTVDSLPGYAESALSCGNCHRNAGRDTTALPLYGAYVRYPRFVARAGRTASIQDRVNFCFTRSLAGRALPDTSGPMRAIVAYLASLGSSRVASDTSAGLIAGDSSRGAALFVAQCVRCHGGGGLGTVVAPPLWGPRSFNIGAGLARTTRMAPFIRHAMPGDRPGTLSDQEAADLAVFVERHPRPDFVGKEHDWPAGDAPSDVPYATAGHHPP